MNIFLHFSLEFGSSGPLLPRGSGGADVRSPLFGGAPLPVLCSVLVAGSLAHNVLFDGIFGKARREEGLDRDDHDDDDDDGGLVGTGLCSFVPACARRVVFSL